jgi:RNA polymerase sigma-70 factor (ECF subfamily)
MTNDRIGQLQEFDETAFRKLVDDYRDMVFRTCMGIVRNAYDADDLAQEVFIEVFNSISTFRADSKISTWLYRIAVNKSLNFLRSQKRKRFFQSIGLASTSDVPEQSYSSDSIENDQRKQILDAAIQALPENQRTAFILHKIEDLSYKEISEIMEVSLSSVESLLFRAKQNLQKRLLKCYQQSC